VAGLADPQTQAREVRTMEIWIIGVTLGIDLLWWIRRIIGGGF